jgi:hypothetical protein
MAETCCEVVSGACSREEAFRIRLRSVLAILGCQYPELFQNIDFWRPAIVGPEFDDCGNEKFRDEIREKWVRLGESVAAFVYEKIERFYQADVGIVRMKIKWVLIPADMGIRAGDHVIISGMAYMVVDATTQSGVAKLQVDYAKSRFVRPARSDNTYRQLEIKAAIQ